MRAWRALNTTAEAAGAFPSRVGAEPVGRRPSSPSRARLPSRITSPTTRFVATYTLSDIASLIEKRRVLSSVGRVSTTAKKSLPKRARGTTRSLRATSLTILG